MMSGDRMIYIDTSVIINSFFSNEAGSENSKEIMRMIKTKNLSL